jgi:Uma2 family endonuclease
MAVVAKRTPVTEDAYFEMLEKSEIRLEYWAGTVVGMAGGSPEHCRLETNLVGEIFQQLKGRPCEAFTGNQSVYVTSRDAYVFPDVSIVCGRPEWITRRGIGCLLNPTVLIEVLSPSTSNKDETAKLLAYTTMRSVREYVMVYADQCLVKLFARSQADEVWKLTIYSKPDEVLELASCGVKLGLDEIYGKVEFSEHSEDGIGEQGSES